MGACSNCQQFNSVKLMEIEDELWDELDIASGTALKASPTTQAKYLALLRKRLGKPDHQYGQETYDALEDANYHTLNQALIILGYAHVSAKSIYEQLRAHPEYTNFAQNLWPENPYKSTTTD